MVAGRFRLPDVDGVLVTHVLEEMAGRKRPPKGQPWDRLERTRMRPSPATTGVSYAHSNASGQAGTASTPGR